MRVHVDTAWSRFILIFVWSLGLASVVSWAFAAIWCVWTCGLAFLLTRSQTEQAQHNGAEWSWQQQGLKLVYALTWGAPPALALWSQHPMGQQVGLAMIFGGMLVLVANYGVVRRRLLLESLVYLAVLGVYLLTHLSDGNFAPALAIVLLLVVVSLDSSGVMNDTGQHLLVAQDKMEKAKVRAEEINRSRAAFIADLNHEIRTPLNGVLGLASALGQSKLDPQQREIVSLIETSGETLERLLSDLIDLSRIAEGRFELKPRPINLHETVSKAAELMRSRAQEKGLRFEVTFGPFTEDWFIGDSVRIRQIISNLTSNAVKFTRTGHIRVCVSLDQQCSDDTYASINISVEDSGPGFDGATHKRLFQRFEQGQQQSETEVRGAGLGLTISRALAERMQGDLSAISAPGQGSTFTLKLRLKRTHPPFQNADTALPPDFSPALQHDQLKVLLAEDHPVNQRVVAQILSPLSPAVTFVSNGVDAVKAFENGVFDLILMDMQMDGMDGLDATQRIRSRERLTRQHRTPILMLSAHSSDSYVKRATAAGVDSFLSKPLTAESLLTRINMVTGGPTKA